MTTKHALFCLLLLVAATGRAAAEDFPASDGRITWVGRTDVRDGTVSFDWSGVYAIVHFRGSELRLRASDSGKDYFNVWIDRDAMDAVPDRTFCLSSRDTTLTLFSGAQGEHRVLIQKRTEGEQGCASFHAFCAETLVQARAVRERVIEFIGDSYTCGYGTLSNSALDPFTPETEDCNRTYAAVIARYFGADFWLIAHSGMGIARNYADALPGYYMPARYLQTFDQRRDPVWPARSYGVKPALSVIYLGTNDASVNKQPAREAFVENYLTLIRRIKDNYGEAHPVLCVVPKVRDFLLDYIQEAMRTCKMERVDYMVLTDKVHDGALDDGDLGASYHPNVKGQLKKAHAILPYISTLTGWSL
ncbi:MAG: hypothetical protein K6E35_06995, partial [Bacteroidales bacterium]|nr:hypothetical protein [Bacteroidales bacterium]